MLPGFSKFLFLKKEGASNILRDFTKPVDINTLNKYFSDRPRIYLMQVQRFNSRKGFSGIQSLRESMNGRVFWTQTYLVPRSNFRGTMVLDLLIHVKNHLDSTLSFRRSCREGICGSCAMCINGTNTLACLKELPTNHQTMSPYQYSTELVTLKISALPHTRPLRDLIGDVTPFYRHYKNIRPWLVTDIDIINAPKDNVNPWKNNSVSGYTKPYLHMKEHFQLDSKRLELDGLYECILCLCCTHSCPSYWWNSDHYVGPAVLLQAFRWLFDSRDMDAPGRITWLSQKSGVYSCNTILSCTQTCPKHLNPGKVISTIKSTISEFENVSLLNRLSSLHSNSGYRISSHDQTSTIFKN